MIHVVSAVFLLVAFEERKPFAIWTPFNTRTPSATARLRDLFYGSARLRIRNINLARRLAIRVGGAIAHWKVRAEIGDEEPPLADLEVLHRAHEQWWRSQRQNELQW